MHTFKSGATASEAKPRYALVPIEAIQALAARFAYGADRHGPNNWRLGITDPEWLSDRLNHTIEHLLLHSNGDKSDDHLAAVLCGVAMLITAREDTRANPPAPAAPSLPAVEIATPTPKATARVDICKRCGHHQAMHRAEIGGPGADTPIPVPCQAEVVGPQTLSGRACMCPVFTPY